MSRLAILASIVALAAGSANCADDPAQSNSIGSITPSSVMAASSDATLSTLAKGGKPALTAGDSTIALVTPDSIDGVANFGEHVTFDVHTSATDYPWVTVHCSQNGATVYQQSLAMFIGDKTFTLGPTPSWSDGAAACVATLENWDSYSNRGRTTALASTPFDVQP